MFWMPIINGILSPIYFCCCCAWQNHFSGRRGVGLLIIIAGP
jgi:hypothetical protein